MTIIVLGSLLCTSELELHVFEVSMNVVLCLHYVSALSTTRLITIDKDLLPGDIATVPRQRQGELFRGGEMLCLEQGRHDQLVQLLGVPLSAAPEHRDLR